MPIVEVLTFAEYAPVHRRVLAIQRERCEMELRVIAKQEEALAKREAILATFKEQGIKHFELDDYPEMRREPQQ